MGLQQTYFSLGGLNPLPLLERLRHPYRHQQLVPLRGKTLRLRWTARAEHQLARRDSPLQVEMQLYFSCVVKKRVLFPELGKTPPHGVAVDGRFMIQLRTVQSDRCDPVEFAANYPIHTELDSTQAAQMRARELRIDYRQGAWQGEFFV
jgi:hypothetical protein